MDRLPTAFAVDGVEVGPESLRDAADAATDAGDVADGVRVREPLNEFKAAMPGARAGRAGSELGLYLNGLLKGWAEGTRQYAKALDKAAALYEATDEAAARDFKSYWDYDRDGGPTR